MGLPTVEPARWGSSNTHDTARAIQPLSMTTSVADFAGAPASRLPVLATTVTAPEPGRPSWSPLDN